MPSVKESMEAKMRDRIEKEVIGMRRWVIRMLCACLVVGLAACSALGEETLEAMEVEYEAGDMDASLNTAEAVSISFGGAAAEIGGAGARLDGNVLTILEEGDYRLSGRFSGRIVIDAGKKKQVRLILDGLTLESGESTAVFVRKAKKATLTLADGSENTVLAGGAMLVEEEEELDAAIYSKADLVVNGGGRLNVDAPRGHGMLSKDRLTVTGGELTINAAQDGLRGKDAVCVAGGVTTVVAAEDGVKSNNDKDAEHGWISVDGGVLNVSAGDDALKAENLVQIRGGTVDVIRAHEGVEARRVLIAGGETSICSEEDGINASGGASAAICVTGGVLRVDAGGDGLDSNGWLRFEGGSVYVSGSVSGEDGALDAAGRLSVRGGVLLACGAVEEAQTPVSDGQAAVLLTADMVQAGGAEVSVCDEAGQRLAAFTPAKAWQCVVVSAPGVQPGGTLSLWVGGEQLISATVE